MGRLLNCFLVKFLLIKFMPLRYFLHNLFSSSLSPSPSPPPSSLSLMGSLIIVLTFPLFILPRKHTRVWHLPFLKLMVLTTQILRRWAILNWFDLCQTSYLHIWCHTFLFVKLELLIATLIDLDAMDGKRSVSLIAECSSSPDVNTRYIETSFLLKYPSITWFQHKS